jgi:hypothetical protein
LTWARSSVRNAPTRAPRADSRPRAALACCQAAYANSSGPSARAGTRAGTSSPVKYSKYGSQTRRSHTPSSDRPKLCLSRNSPMTKRVSMSRAPSRFKARRSLNRSTPSRSSRQAEPTRVFVFMIWSSRDQKRSPEPVVSCRFVPLLSMRSENHDLRRAGIQNRQTKSQGFEGSNPRTVQPQNSHSNKTRNAINALVVVHGRLLTQAGSLKAGVDPA